jgi:hypothetical protein
MDALMSAGPFFADGYSTEVRSVPLNVAVPRDRSFNRERRAADFGEA